MQKKNNENTKSQGITEMNDAYGDLQRGSVLVEHWIRNDNIGVISQNLLEQVDSKLERTKVACQLEKKAVSCQQNQMLTITTLSSEVD